MLKTELYWLKIQCQPNSFCLKYCFQTYFHHIALRVYHPVTNFNQQCTVKTTPVTLYKHVPGKKKILNKISVYQDCQITAMKSNCYKKISITRKPAELCTQFVRTVHTCMSFN